MIVYDAMSIKRPLQFLSDFWKKIRSQWSSDPLERCQWIRLPSTRRSRSEKQKDQLAREGEKVAEQFLSAKGYTILHRNVRFPEGELDFVAKLGASLVFIEVKTRQTEKFGQPYRAVSEKKQRRQAAMASRFISICRLQDISIQFDVVSIVLPPGEQPQIEHIENAFWVKDIFK